MKRILMLMDLFFCIYDLNAQQKYSLSEIEGKLSQSPKNLIIKFQTDQCGICAIQDKKIQKNEELIKLLNDRFYYIEFDAESIETLQLFGKSFEPGKNKIHEFVEEI